MEYIYYNENIRFQQKNVVNSNEYYALPKTFIENWDSKRHLLAYLETTA